MRVVAGSDPTPSGPLPPTRFLPRAPPADRGGQAPIAVSDSSRMRTAVSACSVVNTSGAGDAIGNVTPLGPVASEPSGSGMS